MRGKEGWMDEGGAGIMDESSSMKATRVLIPNAVLSVAGPSCLAPPPPPLGCTRSPSARTGGGGGAVVVVVVGVC